MTQVSALLAASSLVPRLQEQVLARGARFEYEEPDDWAGHACACLCPIHGGPSTVHLEGTGPCLEANGLLSLRALVPPVIVVPLSIHPPARPPVRPPLPHPAHSEANSRACPCVQPFSEGGLRPGKLRLNRDETPCLSLPPLRRVVQPTLKSLRVCTSGRRTLRWGRDELSLTTAWDG